MTTSSSWQRSRAIFRCSLAVVRRQPRLLLFPVLTLLALSVVVALAVLVAGFAQLLGPTPMGTLPDPFSILADEPGLAAVAHRGGAVAGLVVWLGGSWVATSGAVAMTHAALEALAGRPWTFAEAFAHVVARRGAIAGFSILRATVGRLTARRRRQGLGRALLRTAWWAATYLAIPVLTREGRGPIGTVERSARLLRETWKETFLGRFGLVGWWWAGAIVVVVPWLALGVGSGPVRVGIPLVVVLGLGLLFRGLDQIYRAALYVFATEGVIPEPFDDEDLREVWHVA